MAFTTSSTALCVRFPQSQRPSASTLATMRAALISPIPHPLAPVHKISPTFAPDSTTHNYSEVLDYGSS